MSVNAQIASGWSKQISKEDDRVAMDSLSRLTGFPTGFIKMELLVDKDELSIAELRKKVIDYIEKTKQMLSEV